MKDFVEKLQEALRNRHFILIAGNCRVYYEGRAASHLGYGERVVLIKQDGSILVHRPYGHEPVNWNPPGSRIEARRDEEDRIILTSLKSGEKLVVVFNDVKHFAVLNMLDDAEFEMYASEADMKQAVLLEPRLIEDGFTPVEDERKAFGSGRIDILGRDKNGNLVIVELKRNEASVEDVQQVLGYLSSLTRELGRRPRAIIVAPSISRRAAMLANSNNIEFKCLTPRLCMDVLKRRKGLDRFLE
ncbi:MAG TPA: DUF91 domain-containing protein [Candidatus Caldiarchaeum subterraneum]|uniref:Endonuclease NucS n=1 Tax=Caldiarchaeum subterraneum TaxID=311458 RepID=A0A833E987_CALS0|nr:DUF91 domain-containing protein [Candidatus Caldarchaeum subterraneum]